MATTTFYVPAGDQDGGYTGHTNTTIVAYNRGPSKFLPAVNEPAWANFATSGLADDQYITGIEFNWNNSAYTQSPGVGQTYGVFLFATSGGGSTQLNGTLSFSTGWQSHTLNSTEMSALSLSPTRDIQAVWGLADPGYGKFRQLNVYAYESGTNVSYIVITHEDLPAETASVMMLG